MSYPLTVVALLGVVGVCIAPATLALTVTFLIIQILYRVLQAVVSRTRALLPAQVQDLMIRLASVVGRG
jgi:hypothetical protein